MYLSKYSEILTIDGYKNIQELRIGDKLFNMNFDELTINGIEKIYRNDITIIYYENWYMPLYCSNDTKLLILRKDQELKEMLWCKASDIKNNDILLKSEYNAFYIYGDEIYGFKVGYNLGYFLGIYIKYGRINDENIEINLWNKKSRIKIINIIQKLLNKSKINVLKDKVNIQNSELKNILMDIDIDNTKIIPNKFLNKNKDYIKGLIDGLMDNNKYIPDNKNMAISFINCCNYANIAFYNDSPLHVNKQIFPLFFKEEKEDNILGEVLKTNNIKEEQELWLISTYSLSNEKNIIVNNTLIKTL